LQQQFDVAEPNRVWVTDITYIRTHEGWLFLAAVLDLFSRQVIGWSMRSRIDSELAINALAPGRVTAATEDSVDRSFRPGEPIWQA
jgi:transposase InsO family protein